MYVAARLDGMLDNRIYSPRKQGFLDRLEKIKLEPRRKEHTIVPIGTEAMNQLKTLAKNDALSMTLDDLLDGFNTSYKEGDVWDTNTTMNSDLLKDQIPLLADQVNAPSHYMLWPDTEVIDILRKVLTEDELRGWMKGNSLKYRLRLGAKDNTEQDLAKAQKFEEWLGDLH